MLPLVTVITPVYNGGEVLENTIISVLAQTYSNIEYIVIDGNSTDNTLAIIDKYKNGITQVISEPDEGMYDALAKGFSASSGEIICYINAGDWFYPAAIETVVDVFNNHHIQWLTGYRSICNENNVVTRIELPFRYKNKLIQSGSYGQRLPFIQQESTFWRKSLLNTVDVKILRKLRLAGDYYLWFCFSKESQIEIISAPLGVFKIHSGQLSEGLGAYWKEVASFTTKTNLLTRMQEFWEIIFWAMIPKVRDLFVNNIWKYDHKRQKWFK